MARLHRALRAALGTLASAGSLLPSIGMGAGIVLALAVPPSVSGAPTPLGTPLAVEPHPTEPSPQVALVDRIVARRTNGIGLQVRRQLAEAVVAEAQAAHLNPLFILAVMTVESEFDEDATSIRGARGLMQIRPATLAFVAQREGLRLPADQIVRDPVLTARLAIRYLGRLNVAFKGDLDLALMAYNAGPHRVNSILVQGDCLGHLEGYPRAVRRTWQQLLNRPSTDNLAVAALRVPAGPSE